MLPLIPALLLLLFNGGAPIERNAARRDAQEAQTKRVLCQRTQFRAKLIAQATALVLLVPVQRDEVAIADSGVPTPLRSAIRLPGRPVTDEGYARAQRDRAGPTSL